MSLPDEVEWIGPCTAVDDEHMHISVYLIDDGDSRVLVDTGSVVHRDGIIDRLETVLDGAGLDALLLTHTDLPHSANIDAVDDRWPEAEVWCGSGHPVSHGLPKRTQTYDDSNRIAGRRFQFVAPIVKDRSNTTWVFDEGTGVLFTSDAFGYHHASDECDLTMGELVEHDRYATDRVFAFHRTSLPWLRYVDPPMLRAEVRSIMDRRDVSAIAPSHGPPITDGAIDPYLDEFDGVVQELVTRYKSARSIA